MVSTDTLHENLGEYLFVLTIRRIWLMGERLVGLAQSYISMIHHVGTSADPNDPRVPTRRTRVEWVEYMRMDLGCDFYVRFGADPLDPGISEQLASYTIELIGGTHDRG